MSAKSLDKPRVSYLCQRCGNCCRWPGDVIVTGREISAIAAHQGLSEDDFIQHHTRLSANRRHLSLTAREDGSCEFLDGNNVCRIQPVKPEQCRGFPNRWRFDGWRELCEAVEVPAASRWPGTRLSPERDRWMLRGSAKAPTDGT